jgi:hypothetical protein
MALPVRTTVEDVRAIVAYLKNKPTGATTAEVKAALGAPAIDQRKLTAYSAWDLVARDDDRLKLTQRGWGLARKPDSEAEVLRGVIDRVVPYRSALEWIHHQGFEDVTFSDVAAQWHENHRAALGTENETSIKDAVGTFSQLAEAAGLGRVLRGGGRARKPSRFRPDRDALKHYVEAGPSAPPWEESGEDSSQESDEVIPEGAGDAPPEPPPIEEPPTPPTLTEPLRVFIAHGKNMEIVEQVQTMLGLADIEGEVAEAEETTAIPVPEKVFDAMRRCRAGIIVVSVDEGHGDNLAINENVLIEIGAAFVLYERRVVLVWDKRLPVPSNLQGLYRCEFEGDDLSWSAGMKLMKAIQQFKK